MRSLWKGLVSSCALLALVAQSEAALIPGPAPDSVTVVHSGLRWAYVSPVADTTFGGNTLLLPSDNGNVGWRFATLAELALRPDVSLFSALVGGAAAAVPYWNTVFTHVDTGDYSAGFVTSERAGSPGAAPGASGTWETVYVKDLQQNPVPEPATMALFGIGSLGLLGFSRRRK